MNQKLLYRIVRDAPDGILEFDKEGYVILMNPAAQKIIGTNKQSGLLYSSIIAENLNEGNDDFHQAIVNAILDPNKVIRKCVSYTNTDGQKYTLSITCSYLCDEDGTEKGVVINMHDVSEIQDAKCRADAANQMKSKFIEHITHEIRTPLNAIQGFSALLSDPAMSTDKSELAEAQQQMQINVDKLTKIMEGILEISNYDSYSQILKTEEVSIFELLLQQSSTPIPEGKSLQIILDENDLLTLSLHTNISMMTRLLQCLMDNAIKFTSEGQIHLGAERIDDHAIQIYVQDCGPGIPSGKEEIIFERFRKLDPYNPGIGLGLSLARSIANVLAMTVQVDTTHQGPGARFVVQAKL